MAPGHGRRRRCRVVGAAGLVVALAGGAALSGCAPAPSPAPVARPVASYPVRERGGGAHRRRRRRPAGGGRAPRRHHLPDQGRHPPAQLQRPAQVGRHLLRGTGRGAGRRAEPEVGVLRRRQRRDPGLGHGPGLRQRPAGGGHPAGVARQRLGGPQRLGPAQRLGRPARGRRHADPRRPLQRQRPARHRRQRRHRDPPGRAGRRPLHLRRARAGPQPHPARDLRVGRPAA